MKLYKQTIMGLVETNQTPFDGKFFDTAWIHCMADNVKPGINPGKWMIFKKGRKEGEECWDKLVKAVKDEEIKWFKCSVDNELNPRAEADTWAFMIYTNDYKDIDDVKRIHKYLDEKGIKGHKAIYYKTDETTKSGLYKETGKSWLYSSYTLKNIK